MIFVLFLSIHLAAVNLATAGPLVALWFARRGRIREDGPAGWMAGQLIRRSIAALAIGIGLGLAAGVTLWLYDSARLEAAIRALPYARLRDGVWELGFYFLCLMPYLPLCRPARRLDGVGVAARVTQWILVLAATSNLAYHFPFLFTTLAETRTAASTSEIAPVTVAEMLARWKDPAFLAQFVHFMFACVAVAGAAVMWLSLRLAKLGVEQSEQQRIAVYGARIAAVPSVLQLAVGIYFLLVLPDGLQSALMGESILATMVFGVSLLTALALMHRLVSLAMGNCNRSAVVQTIVLLLVTITLMTGALHAARNSAMANT
ncbi:MAG: hypothetical protein MI757_01855 [Pirellulales bacterium]|nr:hypothetical protein [Pirellulales bacterium]